MASLSRISGRTYRIQFFSEVGKRLAVYLPASTPPAIAETVQTRIELILIAKREGINLDRETSLWLAGIDGTLHDKLANVGLVEPRRRAKIEPEPEPEPEPELTLGDFLDSHFAKRTDVKDSTRIVYRRARRLLIQFFTDSRSLASITEGDAEDWQRFLKTCPGKSKESKMAEATVRRMCGFARTFFTAAVKHRLIPSNPFKADGIKTSNTGNDDRLHFVPLDDVDRVLDACPDHEWRLIFALSRFAGLRCPSETLALKWDHIDWGRSVMRVPEPKVEHHKGRGERVVPIFPELMPYLREAYENAPDGAVYVITRYRRSDQNLRTQFAKIITRAGVKPWPRPFHNLRASRQTELTGRFPEHVVNRWLGNSREVARRHYLQVTEADLQRAASEPTGRAVAHSIAHSVAQQPRATGYEGGTALPSAHEKTPFSRGFAQALPAVAEICEAGQWTILDSNQ